MQADSSAFYFIYTAQAALKKPAGLKLQVNVQVRLLLQLVTHGVGTAKPA